MTLYRNSILEQSAQYLALSVWILWSLFAFSVLIKFFSVQINLLLVIMNGLTWVLQHLDDDIEGFFLAPANQGRLFLNYGVHDGIGPVDHEQIERLVLLLGSNLAKFFDLDQKLLDSLGAAASNGANSLNGRFAHGNLGLNLGKRALRDVLMGQLGHPP